MMAAGLGKSTGSLQTRECEASLTEHTESARSLVECIRRSGSSDSALKAAFPPTGRGCRPLCPGMTDIVTPLTTGGCSMRVHGITRLLLVSAALIVLAASGFGQNVLTL